MPDSVKIETVNGRPVIKYDSLTYCNLKYHSPYLAVISSAGDMIWQDKEYTGYGKHRVPYYDVSKLKAGDLIQMAGGSGGNKYPYKGRVIERNAEELTVEKISDQDFSNMVAALKIEAPAPLSRLESLRAQEAELIAALERVRAELEDEEGRASEAEALAAMDRAEREPMTDD